MCAFFGDYLVFAKLLISIISAEQILPNGISQTGRLRLVFCFSKDFFLMLFFFAPGVGGYDVCGLRFRGII
ncbi:MAG: hypothetical protein COZ46_06980 [Verrucomicrobia bacterium CG_4_10_14_3_um_filter_43_23]|nr:MAG: hypothetical protein AUJ82_05000 [Verrucomicrobia bacterium CG1_02_43_26]PIP59832.1 MAG: hypothetical protein COX01_01585 [Verrucomicrobia bacterium CG22_combo_CG10-13_8_21_14_all_43_17]PIX57844.1 MAG: hypothetical protein COZ46_06980 [Verrucomicrobia bacterium CG_4_10_14_3_um_filter_43_23]PIY63049.1 MAG: hypothetical protein COY94_00525 [Verrucomicrobia bacterium CG_4_10_14_0_8_um_filter_43_34]PJA43703.1 MAG: hypothetical protein CO175_06640 [Verrucomicrobia bacterium CG_4_9_14_3_um_fi